MQILMSILFGIAAVVILLLKTSTSTSHGVSLSSTPTPTPSQTPAVVQEQDSSIIDRLRFRMPEGWQQQRCEGSLVLQKTDELVTCATEPSAFPILIAADDDVFYQMLKGDSTLSVKTLTVGGRKSEVFVQHIPYGMGAGTYTYTVIPYDEFTMIYVVLNRQADRGVYDNVLKTMKIE